MSSQKWQLDVIVAVHDARWLAKAHRNVDDKPRLDSCEVKKAATRPIEGF
jgi:hypothetical protein